ncbi:hypothetical protein ADILRU_1189 [Leifsonia rubra CMS 76R]|nr:hypothetical protein ADILRU_1189 [Leifsonia rubra CMS 76R]
MRPLPEAVEGGEIGCSTLYAPLSGATRGARPLGYRAISALEGASDEIRNGAIVHKPSTP